MSGKIFSFEAFSIFRKFCWVRENTSWITFWSMNPGYDILIMVNLNALILWYCFLQLYKYFMLNKMQIYYYQETLLIAFDLLNLNTIESQIFGSEALFYWLAIHQHPFWAIKSLAKIKRSNHQQLQEQCQQQLPTNWSCGEVPNSKKHFLLLPYKGKRLIIY